MDNQLAAEILILVAMMAATIEYCELMRRRRQRRVDAALGAEADAIGLQGLVRVFLADTPRVGKEIFGTAATLKQRLVRNGKFRGRA